uniref:Uncharacterized protein n=1 Tax=Rangifer tarandus platyrhynchus TaxID=3082113 RepID=A0ACB0EW61_RANTA|nr:unnamed protein product [Rangifer tarandus platyrhynchus]
MQAADSLRQLRFGTGGEHQTALHVQVTDSDDGEMPARREPGPTVGQEPAGAGAGSRPYGHTAHLFTPLDPGLPDPDPDLDFGLAQPSPAVPDRSGQGRGPRLQHCLPSAGTPPSSGGRPRSQRRRLGFTLQELWDLRRQAVLSAALSPDSPYSPPRWMLCPGAQVQLRGSKRGQLHGPSHVGLGAWPLPLQAKEPDLQLLAQERLDAPLSSQEGGLPAAPARLACQQRPEQSTWRARCPVPHGCRGHHGAVSACGTPGQGRDLVHGDVRASLARDVLTLLSLDGVHTLGLCPSLPGSSGQSTLTAGPQPPTSSTGLAALTPLPLAPSTHADPRPWGAPLRTAGWGLLHCKDSPPPHSGCEDEAGGTWQAARATEGYGSLGPWPTLQLELELPSEHKREEAQMARCPADAE